MTLRPLARFGRDGRGVAIVEFALIAPLLILFYVGMAELVQGLMAERKSSHAASSIGDLIAQAPQVTPAEVQSIFAIGAVIMSPYSTGNAFEAQVSSVRVHDDGIARVTWADTCRDNAATSAKECKAWSGTLRKKNDVVDLPKVLSNDGTQKQFLKKGQSAMMAEVVYEFRSPFSEIYAKVMGRGADDGGFTFKSVFFLQPRQNDEVIYKTT